MTLKRLTLAVRGLTFPQRVILLLGFNLAYELLLRAIGVQWRYSTAFQPVLLLGLMLVTGLLLGEQAWQRGLVRGLPGNWGRGLAASCAFLAGLFITPTVALCMLWWFPVVELLTPAEAMNVTGLGLGLIAVFIAPVTLRETETLATP